MKAFFIIFVFMSTFLKNCSKNKNQPLSSLSKDMLDNNFKTYLEEGNKTEAVSYLNSLSDEKKANFIDPSGRTFPMVILELFKGKEDDLYDLFKIAFQFLPTENLNQTNTPEGNTLLHLALKNGHDLVIKDIINKDGIDLNMFNISDQESPFCLAIKMGKLSIVKMFIEKQKKLQQDMQRPEEEISLLNEEVNGEGDKPFMVAIKSNKINILSYLWQVNSKIHASLINKKNNKEMVPLILAIDLRNIEMVRFLLEKNADPTMKVMGITPLIWAGHKKYEMIVEELLAAGGKFESKAHLNFKLVLKILGDILGGVSITASEVASFGAAEINMGQIGENISQHVKERHKFLLNKAELNEANRYIEFIYNEYNWISKVKDGGKEIYEEALSEVILFAEEETKEIGELATRIETNKDHTSRKTEVNKLFEKIKEERKKLALYRDKVNELRNKYPIKELNTAHKRKHKFSKVFKKITHHTSSEEGTLPIYYEILENDENRLNEIYPQIVALLKERQPLLDFIIEIHNKAEELKLLK